MTFFFSAPTDALRDHLRPGEELWVGADGLGAFEMGYVAFHDGNQGLPAFEEVSLAVRRANTFDLPWPLADLSTMGFETRNIGADNAAFLDHAEGVDRLPVYRPLLSFAHSTSAAGLPRVVVSDESGEIASFERTAKAKWYIRCVPIRARVIHSPLDGSDRYYETRFWYSGPFRVSKEPQAVRLHSGHPFFRGLDVSAAKSIEVFFSPPDTSSAKQIFGPPAPL